ncbi:MAG: ABC transporter ATP-binding protein [Bacteroidota bacterium]|jgi:ATP-binding cassette subfamily B protein|nr:ABC transporter ATP-binding protein [Bacteroidota bacterium]
MKSLWRLMPYFRRYRRTLIWGIIHIFLSTVFAVIAPIIIRDAVDGLQADLSSATLVRYALLLVAVALASGIFLYLTRQTIIVVSRRIEFDLRNDFLAHVMQLSQRYFATTTTGDLMAYSSNDISAVRMFVGPAVMYSANTVFNFVIIVWLLVEIHPMLTLWGLLPLPILSFAVYRVGSLIHKRYEEIQEHYGTMTARTQESISGIRVVKAYLREDHETEVFRELSEEYMRRNMRMVRIQSLFMPMIGILVGFSSILILWLGGLDVIAGQLTLGELTQFIIYLGMLIWPMAAIGWVVGLIQRAAASMKRLERVLDTAPDIVDTAATNHDVTTIQGHIGYEDVYFRYDPARPDVLAGISLEIRAGMTLGVIGLTGAGKSTLVSLIPRLFDPTAGVLRIDGRDARDIPVAVLRRHIAYVTQETFLFSDTLRNNIAYGVDGAREDDILWAAGIAQMDKDVADFPKHYDTMLGERGITLSGGQKQRVSLARAVLRKPSILILDDALSAVDTHTEEDILQRLKSVMAERTSILISHRISTVKHADHIIVLRDGVIGEQGTHDELVALGGLYAELHQKQLLAAELEEME